MSLTNLFLPYDLYERHAAVSQLLLDALVNVEGPIRVLDVGGRCGLLERFVPYRSLSVNIDGSADLWGDGCALPTADDSFTAVVSIDALEHLPEETRLLFVQEGLRVARHCVIVAAPFASQGHAECEEHLNELHRSTYGRPNAYLSEHIEHGLPDMTELDRLVHQSDARASRLMFAGDYVRQGKLFKRSVRASGGRGPLARLRRLWHHISSLAMFHPINLRGDPGVRSNRFYLVLAPPKGE